jgi:hypothetical protein
MDEKRLAELEHRAVEAGAEVVRAEELEHSDTGFSMNTAAKRNARLEADRALAEGRREFEQEKRERAEAATQQANAASRDTAAATWATAKASERAAFASERAAKAALWVAVLTAAGVAVTAGVALLQR